MGSYLVKGDKRKDGGYQGLRMERFHVWFLGAIDLWGLRMEGSWCRICMGDDGVKIVWVGGGQG